MKRIDSFIGSQLVNLLPIPTIRPSSTVRSVLVIRPGGIGDALLLGPAINSLKLHLPDITITVLAESRNAGAFSLIKGIDKLLLYDNPADFIQLTRSRYDLIIDSEQWHRLSAVVARLIPSAMKIGFDTNERRRLFTHVIPYAQDDYEAISFLNLLSPLGITDDFDYSASFLSLAESAVKETDNLLNSITTPYITIFPGASVRERRWGSAKFRLLVRRIAVNGVNSVIIGSSADNHSGEAIISGSTALNLAGKTTIAGTAALIRKSSLLVSGDSGVLHLGVGLGVPTVSFFGAGIANKWAPRRAIHKVINRKLHCSPCTLFGTTPVCPYGVKCLDEITVDIVYETVMNILYQNKVLIK